MKIVPRKFYFDDFMGDIMDMDNKMNCDIYEKDGIYHLEMDIPGFRKEDISIECDKGNLTITVERENEENDDSKNYLRRERTYGKYSRSFYLGEIDEDNIEASFENGMLKIMAPKATKNETKKSIEIK